MTNTAHRHTTFKKLLLPMKVGGLCGVITVAVKSRLIDPSPGFSASALFAGTVGVIYIITALAVLWGVFFPDAGAKFLNVEDAEELREKKAKLVYSVVGATAIGLALLIMAMSGPGGWIAPTFGAILAIGLIALGVILSKFIDRHSDELQQVLSREAMALSFVLTALIGGGWAILANTKLLPTPAPLDWLTLIAVTLIFAVFWQWGKRGMLTRGPN